MLLYGKGGIKYKCSLVSHKFIFLSSLKDFFLKEKYFFKLNFESDLENAILFIENKKVDLIITEKKYQDNFKRKKKIILVEEMNEEGIFLYQSAKAILKQVNFYVISEMETKKIIHIMFSNGIYDENEIIKKITLKLNEEVSKILVIDNRPFGGFANENWDFITNRILSDALDDKDLFWSEELKSYYLKPFIKFEDYFNDNINQKKYFDYLSSIEKVNLIIIYSSIYDLKNIYFLNNISDKQILIHNMIGESEKNFFEKLKFDLVNLYGSDDLNFLQINEKHYKLIISKLCSRII